MPWNVPSAAYVFRRARQAPSGQLVRQLANAVLTPLVARPFRLVHVVEYPKCGGSWVRNMICDYRRTAPYLNDRLIRPRDVVQLHRMYRRSYPFPVVVVRDPRDVFVSYYYHETRLDGRAKRLPIAEYYTHDPGAPVEEDFARYLRAKLMNRTYPPFSYADFVQSWIHRPRICLVRYEDLLADCGAELLRIVRFLRERVDLDHLASVVERNSFEAETRQRYGKGRKPGEADPTKPQRKGIAGDWRNHFNAEACELIQRFEGGSLEGLGYERDRSWVDRYLAERAEVRAGQSGWHRGVRS